MHQEALQTSNERNIFPRSAVRSAAFFICFDSEQEGDDFENEEASPNKRKKDPHKVDKKYLWPHGLGPPLKNCRKRRFRKTRKKKYVEAPEIEKEVGEKSAIFSM